MYFLFFIIVFTIVYIKSFKDNFTAETIDKVTPIILLVSLVVVALGIISSILG